MGIEKTVFNSVLIDVMDYEAMDYHRLLDSPNWCLKGPQKPILVPIKSLVQISVEFIQRNRRLKPL